jgi:formate--tetrahydrofolate ligase
MKIRIQRPTPPSYIIAAHGFAHARPIEDVASDMGLPTDPGELYPYGHIIAKIDASQVQRHLRKREDGHIVIVTAMTPTPKGSGKTLTTIALTDAMNRALGRKGKPCQKATAVLREPSMGPVLGMKGGAAGGGYCQVIPMEDINLHFTGDIHAIGSAHNLLFAMAMAYAFEGKNQHAVDLHKFIWPRVVDMVDRSLREIHLSASGKYSDTDMRVKSRYVITAASEVMATLGLAKNIDDLRQRLGRIIVGSYKDGTPLTAQKLEATGGMLAILLQAFNPNLVQTLDGNGVFIHTGPFANIAHGNSSVTALQLAVKASDYVMTEGGFAADLGAQKFLDIVCRTTGKHPSCAVIVCSGRDLKYQGGMEPEGTDKAQQRLFRFAESVEGCLAGMYNLRIHIENLRKYGVPVVVALNRFATDTDKEIDAIVGYVRDKLGAPCVPHTGYVDGPAGAEKLAQAVLDTIVKTHEKTAKDFKLLYPRTMHLKGIIETIAHEIYRAGEVKYARGVESQLRAIEATTDETTNVCMSKTQFSITDDGEYRGNPTGKPLTITKVRYAGGPGWVVALCGTVFEMPGMTYATAGARKLELERDDESFSGFVIKNLG